MQNPMIHSADKTWAPSGIAYHKGNLYIALRGEALKRYNIQTKELANVVTNVGRIRDVFIRKIRINFRTIKKPPYMEWLQKGDTMESSSHVYLRQIF